MRLRGAESPTTSHNRSPGFAGLAFFEYHVGTRLYSESESVDHTVSEVEDAFGSVSETSGWVRGCEDDLPEFSVAFGQPIASCKLVGR